MKNEETVINNAGLLSGVVFSTRTTTSVAATAVNRVNNRRSDQ